MSVNCSHRLHDDTSSPLTPDVTKSRRPQWAARSGQGGPRAGRPPRPAQGCIAEMASLREMAVGCPDQSVAYESAA